MADTASPDPNTGSQRRWQLRVLQAVVTLGAFAYLISIVDVAMIGKAAARISLLAFATSAGLFMLALAAAALRWKLLFLAFGAPNVPSLLKLLRLYLIGQFYNTYLPGGVLGDVVRGLASKEAFGKEGGSTRGLAVVLFERIIGLSGLLTLVAIVTTVRPIGGMDSLVPLGLVGVCAAIAGLAGLTMAHRVAHVFPGPVAKLLRDLPVATRFWPVAAALVLTVGIHAIAAAAGHVLVASIYPATSFGDSVVILPISFATAYMPISFSGAGLREAAAATLYALVGVPEDAAVAGVLVSWAAVALVAAFGGLLVLLQPVRDKPT